MTSIPGDFERRLRQPNMQLRLGGVSQFLRNTSRSHYRMPTKTGDGTRARAAVSASAPVVSSIRNSTIVSDSWLAAIRKSPVGVDGEVSRRPAARRVHADACERAVGADAERRDAVVPPVGAVHEAAVRVNGHFRRRVLPCEAVGQRRYLADAWRVCRLLRPTRTTTIVEFSSFIRNTASPDGRSAKWRGPAPGRRCNSRRPVWLQGARGFVESIDEQPVGTQIRGENERRLRDQRESSVRAHGSAAWGADQIPCAARPPRRRHSAIGAERKRCDAAGSIVGDECVRAARVHRHVAGARAATGLLADSPQCARFFDLERHQRAGLRRAHRVRFADRVEHRPGRMPREEARVDGLRHEHRLGQTRIRAIQRRGGKCRDWRHRCTCRHRSGPWVSWGQGVRPGSPERPTRTQLTRAVRLSWAAA